VIECDTEWKILFPMCQCW